MPLRPPVNGWRAATHAVGDAAVDLALTAYEQGHAAAPFAKGQWVIEHAFISKPDHFARIRNLGLVLSVQDHLYLAAPSLKLISPPVVLLIADMNRILQCLLHN